MNSLIKAFVVAALAFALPTAKASDTWDGATVLNALDSQERVIILNDLAAHGISESDVRGVSLIVHASDTALISPLITGDSPVIEVRDSTKTLTEENLYYLGVRLGFPLVLGINVTCLHLDKSQSPVAQIDVEASTILFISSINIGGFYHPWGNPFYVGARLHQIAISSIFDNNTTFYSTGFGPEVGGAFTLGDSKWGMLRIAVGGVIFNDGSEMRLAPDFKLGFAVKVFGN